MNAIHGTQDFVVMGPAMATGHKALAAIHALYFLPDNYKLMFNEESHSLTDNHLYKQALELIRHNGLVDRVHFGRLDRDWHAVVWHEEHSEPQNSHRSLHGNSAEELASAILRASKTRSKS